MELAVADAELQGGFALVAGSHEDVVAVLPITRVVNEVISRKQRILVAQQVLQIFFAPHVIFAFFAIAVGIEGRIKISFGHKPFLFYKIEGFEGYFAVKFVTGKTVGFGIKTHQLRIVVQHFFEVWYFPQGVGAVAGKAAVELVVQTPKGHFAQRKVQVFEGFLVFFEQGVTQ